MSDASSAPILAAEDARIVVDGAAAIDRLTLVTRGDRALFAGDPAALFAAITGVPLSSRRAARASTMVDKRGHRVTAASELDDEAAGEASVVAGKLLLAGRSVGDGAHVEAMGAAPLDPPLPPGWSVEEYVTWGARLAGVPKRAAAELARAALARLGLFELRRRGLGSLPPELRRVAVLAQAVAAEPEVLLAEAPLAGLEGEAAARVGEALARAAEGRRLLTSAARLDPGSPEGALARGASWLAVLAGGEIALEGTPAELFSGARLYALVVHRNAEPLRAELSAHGIRLKGGPVRFAAELPAGATTREILLAAKAAGATVVELLPLLG